jgi:hypothetical protein
MMEVVTLMGLSMFLEHTMQVHLGLISPTLVATMFVGAHAGFWAGISGGAIAGVGYFFSPATLSLFHLPNLPFMATEAWFLPGTLQVILGGILGLVGDGNTDRLKHVRLQLLETENHLTEAQDTIVTLKEEKNVAVAELKFQTEKFNEMKTTLLNIDLDDPSQALTTLIYHLKQMLAAKTVAVYRINQDNAKLLGALDDDNAPPTQLAKSEVFMNSPHFEQWYPLRTVKGETWGALVIAGVPFLNHSEQMQQVSKMCAGWLSQVWAPAVYRKRMAERERLGA